MVGISLLTLVPGVVGGSETYCRELLRALGAVGELDYVVFLPTVAPGAAEGLAAETVRSYRASRAMSGRIRAMGQAALLPASIRRELRLERLEAIHFPLSVMLPRVDRPPAATTIHDLQHEAYPRFFPRAEVAYRRLVYGWTARASRLIVTPSRFVGDTLVERLGVEPGRVRVIPHGIDHGRFRPGEAQPEPFLLYPANRWPHKNHERLFAALTLLRRERPELRLVLTGAGHERQPAPPGVEVRGRVSGDDLVALYRTASALVFPSLYEGFGSPPLEAMACGCPAAVARAGALPEVCGDAARYFAPESPDDIAAAVADVLAEPSGWIERGLARAAAFSWEASARRHEAAYRELRSGRV